MLIDQNQYSSLPVTQNPKFPNMTDESFQNPQNLDSLIGGSIRIVNPNTYQKQLNNNNNSYKTNMTNNRIKPVKPNFKSQNITKTIQNSVSMKNINEIPSKSELPHSNHYNNLQLALKAATAALQKSKITASSNYIPIVNPNQNPTQKTQVNSVNKSKSSKSPSSNSSSSSTTTNSSSTQGLSGSVTSILFNSNQSLFQPYYKIKDKKNSSLASKNKMFRNTLIIETNQININNSHQSNTTSLSSNKLDTSDYDNIENEPSSKIKKISIQLEPILKRQKSASTEYLNSKIDEKTSNDIDEDSLNNYNHLKSDFETIFNNLDKEISNIHSASPQPPKIQPYSGVLSKSLFSLVLKPQALKPGNKIETKTNQKSLLKKKCVSTTNLAVDSTIKKGESNSNETNKIDSLNSNSSKSVTTLNSKNDFSSSDNSINIDDVDCDNESVFDDSSDKDRRLRNLESEVKSRDNIIIELKNKLSLEMEKNKYYQRKVSRDHLEEEKLIYEQKINDLKSHFNQQLALFEENERLQMQNKLSNLQKIYNELKLNYKKNLDAELKALRGKLSESEANAEKLYKQLQVIQSRKSVVSVACQTSSVNERDLNNNNNNNELLFYLRKLKSENNDLKLQLETERRKFQNEKEKWFLQVQAYKRNSMSSNENLSNSQQPQVQTKKNNQMILNQKSTVVNFLNNSSHSSNSDTSRVKNNSTTTSNKQSLVKNLLLNHQHYL
ncbi:unnamed protein product [Brachionus calyciflorus]|uniref:Uncharacterized protein n=1 Tax=Brachionus calyciflorus TaxID=104777 RepID=A0A813RD41_9BILA|nr:unnamed protein product [Brachionus calyciflorus]